MALVLTHPGQHLGFEGAARERFGSLGLGWDVRGSESHQQEVAFEAVSVDERA